MQRLKSKKKKTRGKAPDTHITKSLKLAEFFLSLAAELADNRERVSEISKIFLNFKRILRKILVCR